MLRRLSIVVLLSFLPVPILAQDVNGDGLIQVLVPIAYGFGQSVPGAHGSVWKGEIWLHNDGGPGLFGVQPGGTCIFNCGGFAYPPGHIGLIQAVESFRADGGAILSLPVESEQRFRLSARLLETARRAQPTGVEIPVVREAQFFRGSSSFLAIPTASGVRATLRVYDPRVRSDSRVRVDFLNDAGAVVRSTELAPGLSSNVPLEQIQHWPLTPGYAVIADMAAQFPELQSLPRYHVRVTPLVPQMEYWAFVAVIDNDSQHVLLITSD